MYKCLFNINGEAVFMWIPSHAGIIGNERVDHLDNSEDSLIIDVCDAGRISAMYKWIGINCQYR